MTSARKASPRGAGGARLAALEALLAVLVGGRSLDRALAETGARLADPRDRALARELAYGTLRWLPRLEALVETLVERPLRARDADLRVCLLLGLYQILHTRIPVHAAVSETAALPAARGKPWATGLVNATLRRAHAGRDSWLERVAEQAPARHAHPAWLIERIRDAWPSDWQAVLDRSNERPPMTLRVNARRSTREAYQERLAAAGLAARAAPHTGHGLTLETPVAADRLPGFAQGSVSVQDAAAQLSAPLLRARPGERVLDACAAPGGKTALLLEQSEGDLELVALDPDPERLARVHDTLARLGLDAHVECAAAEDLDAWWDRRPFDRVLVDAPCSGTGVLRRHPDIKHLRRREDLPALAERQQRLLEAAWSVLAPGGRLLYATCSVLPEENWLPIERMLRRHRDAIPRTIGGAWGRPAPLGRQILPGDDGMDGFYYAVLDKR